MLSSGSSIVVEHSSTGPEIQGANPAASCPEGRKSM